MTLATFSLHAGKLNIEVKPVWKDQPLLLGRSVSQHARGISISRLDGLLSELALQRVDGTWIDSKNWHAFFSLEQGRLSATADGVPSEDFQAIRFRVGLTPEKDRANPLDWPPDHPLHPDVCGLHWGWSSGYVFLAIEGHAQHPDGNLDGFSYHLAGPQEPMLVQIGVRFSGKHPTTIQLTLDAATILESGEVLTESSSTHSREGDGVAIALKKRVREAFRLRAVQADSYQPLAVRSSKTETEKRPGTPFPLRISDRLPQVQLPADNPLTVEGVELGRKLFHEKQLSRGNVQSCATCHERANGFAEDSKASTGASGTEGRRNAMPLANLAWGREMFWDGRAASLREQVLLPIQDAHEMNESLDSVIAKLNREPAYPNDFKAAFGEQTITAERIALALEQFLLTLVSQDSKFDRAARKLTALTLQEQRGLELFVTEHDPARGLRGADCFHCHGGNLFTNHKFMNNGLAPLGKDLGRMEVTASEADRGKFKVPTLRNVALTAPYMHDGRFSTLEEVVDHYNGTLHRSAALDPNLAKHPDSGLGLSQSDKAALVAFLKTLTDEDFVEARPAQKQFTQIE